MESAETERKELDAFRMELEHSRILEKALKRTADYLPPGTIGQYENRPKVSFGIYQPDGNAGEIIAVDLKLAMQIDIIGLIAHEAHHYYAVQIRRKLKEGIDDSTRQLIHSIFQLQLEGLADLIDKRDFLHNAGKGFPPQLYETCQKHYKNPFLILNKIDSLLVLSSEYPERAKKNYLLIKEILPLGGHPHGYYMAGIILKRKGKKALLKTIENPFQFIRIYNKAAGKNKEEFIFSKKSIQYLKEIEKSCLLN